MPPVRDALSHRHGLETTLDTSDIELALERMKRGLALLDLRRALLTRAQDARTVLSLTDRILALQGAAD